MTISWMYAGYVLGFSKSMCSLLIHSHKVLHGTIIKIYVY